MNKTQNKGRLQLILVGAAFLGPLLVAYLLYSGMGGWTPGPGTEHGTLLQPASALPDITLVADDAAKPPSFHRKWSLIVVDDEFCRDVCKTALYETRQVRLALGRDRDRVQRLLYTNVDNAALASIAEEHPGLIVLEKESDAGDALQTAAGDFDSGDIFLSDPNGNLIMRFPKGTGMRGMFEDLKHLLKISRIG